MHNREMIWITKEGEKLKIKDISSAHLTNILLFIDSKIEAFKSKYGSSKVKKMKFNIKQEIRFRKLNRINTVSQENDIF